MKLEHVFRTPKCMMIDKAAGANSERLLNVNNFNDLDTAKSVASNENSIRKRATWYLRNLNSINMDYGGK